MDAKERQMRQQAERTAEEIILTVQAYQDLHDEDSRALLELTRRELQALRLMAEGYTSEDMGRIMGVSKRTAENMRVEVKAKLGARHLVDVVKFAVRNRVINLATWAYDRTPGYAAGDDGGEPPDGWPEGAVPLG